MANAEALVVGLKSIDLAAHRWDGTLGCEGCELDVDMMDRILQPLGYLVSTLKTRVATSTNVLCMLASAAARCRSGDTFVFYYSGHGGQKTDLNGDEEDRFDETLVLYDREVLDDELDQIWLRFQDGVRIVMVSDSCHSGTNYWLGLRMVGPTHFRPLVDPQVGCQMRAQMIHLGACRDTKGTGGSRDGSLFTLALHEVWNGGQFPGDYRDFLEGITGVLNASDSTQEPQRNEYGPVTEGFRRSRPFSV